MKDVKYCQSCGMPFDEDHRQYIAKDTNGGDSIFCTYCYKDGEFIEPDATAEDMVETAVPYLARKIGEQAARDHLSTFIPNLSRWNNKN